MGCLELRLGGEEQGREGKVKRGGRKGRESKRERRSRRKEEKGGVKREYNGRGNERREGD